MMQFQKIIFVLSLGAIVGTSGCKESLPTYAPPKDFLVVSVQKISGSADTVNYSRLDENNPNFQPVTVSTPPMGYEIKIVNNYEETIQDDADVQGTVELIWKDKTDLRSELPISITSFYSSHYDPATKMITLNPGDTVTLRVYWNFKLTNTEWAFYKQNFVDSPAINGSGRFYRYHFPMLFGVRTKVKIFRSLSFVETEPKEGEYVVVNFKGLIIPPP